MEPSGGDLPSRQTGSVQATKGEGSSKDIFISYGHDTLPRRHIEKLKQSLEKAGYSVWLDKVDITGGKDWHSVIGAAVKECKALVAIIDSKYTSSQHCKNELFMANAIGKAILPVMLESSVDDPGVQLAISSVNWINAVGAFKPETVAQQIVLGLKALGIT